MDQQQPPPPQEQPQWSPPPQQQAGWGGAAMAPPPRPIGVTLSAVLFLIFGVLAAIAAIVLLAGGTLLEGAFGLGGVAATVGVILAVIAGLFAALYLATGVGLLRGRNWARIVGLVIAVLGIIFGVLGLMGGQEGLIWGIIQIVIWGLVAWALYQAGPYFAYRR